MAAVLLAAGLLVSILTSEVYGQILTILLKGLAVTAFVTVTAFALAAALGLLLAVCVLSSSVVLRQTARFYIEIMRGVPILVLLFYVAFVATPALVAGWNALADPLGLPAAQTRDVSLMWRAIIALTATLPSSPRSSAPGSSPSTRAKSRPRRPSASPPGSASA